MEFFNLKPRAMALMTLGGVWVLWFASWAFGTFSSSLLSGYTCSAYWYFVGFGYGYDCTQNPSVTVTGGSLGTVSTISGSATAADSVTIGTGSNVVFNPVGAVKVTIPSSTIITPVGGGTFDSTAILLNTTSVSSGLGTNEQSVAAVDFWVGSGVGLNFSIPVRIDIPVPGYTDSTISVKVKHAGSSVFTTNGLTNNPNTTCTAGNPVSHASSLATVASSVATIYTCQASTFTTYRVISTTSNYGGGGGGGSYVPPMAYTSALFPTKLPVVTPVVSPAKSNKSRLQALRERLKLLREKRAKTDETPKTVAETPKNVPTYTELTSKVLYVNVSRTALRNEPSHKSTFLGYINRNARVTVLGELDGWVKISTANIKAWVVRDALRLPVTEDTETIIEVVDDEVPYEAKVNVAKVSLWKNPSMTNSKFLGYLFRNQTVTVTKVEGDWAEIKTPYYVWWVMVSRLAKK